MCAQPASVLHCAKFSHSVVIVLLCSRIARRHRRAWVETSRQTLMRWR